MSSRAGPRPGRAPARRLAAACARLAATVPADAAPDAAVTGVTLDSRAVRPGDVYVALPGARVHGARFAADAAAAGAVAVLTDPAGAADAAQAGLPLLVVPDPRGVLGGFAAWIYGEPAEALTLVGITGTNGKTTTAYLVDAALRAGGATTGLVGTVETRIGDERVPSVRTTPEAPDVQALLAVMRERGVAAVTMEVSSHALVLGRVDGTVFDVAVFTNLGQDHLDFHADLEDYFAAKASLFTPERARRGVVCVDDAWGRRVAAGASIPVVTVAGRAGADADWRVVSREVAASAATTEFDLLHRDGTRHRVHAPLAGDFNVVNTALAVVAAYEAGTPLPDAVRGLVGASVPGRMERVVGGGAGEPLAVVDYAHTPDAVAALLGALRPGLTGRLVVVLGAGGDRDRAKRHAMGAAAARLADVVVVTDDNPRCEDPAVIRAAVLAGAGEAAARSGAEVVEVADRRAAVARAVEGTCPGDAVVVAGKGHETGQEVAGRTVPFDDRVVLREALQRRAAAGDTQDAP